MTHRRSDSRGGRPRPVGIGFEDFAEGLVWWTSSLTLTETHIVLWAGVTGDWYPLHMDDEFSREQGPFGQRVAHGPLVFALGVGLMSQAGVFGDALIAWLGCDDLSAQEPVFIGDTIRLEATVKSVRPSQSDPSRGIVSFQYRTVNQHDRTVMLCIFHVMVRSRSNGE